MSDSAWNTLIETYRRGQAALAPAGGSSPDFARHGSRVALPACSDAYFAVGPVRSVRRPDRWKPCQLPGAGRLNDPVAALPRCCPESSGRQLVLPDDATTLGYLATPYGPVGIADAAGHWDLRGAVQDPLTGGLLPVGATNPITTDPNTNQLATPVEAS